MICTRESDCTASSHFSNCASMPSSPTYTQAQVDSLLTTVRKEARAAAFRDAVQSVKTLPQIGRESLDQRSKRILRAIEAAANTEEGD